MEISVKPLREQRLAAANAYASLVESIPNLDIVSIEQPDAWRAAALRASNAMHPADALQIAACMGAGAEVFVTNDRRLRQLNAIDVIILSDYV
jgi:predicted nucleic acid-binding protein